MKLYFFFCIAVVNILLAQQPPTTTYIDDFNSNSVWPQYEDEEGTRKIINGKYVLKSKSEETFPMSCIYPYLDWKKDFIIEVQYAQTSFHSQNISGLVWSRNDGDFNAFFIRMNEFYQIVTFKNNQVETKVKDWTKADVINSSNHINKLRVEKHGETLKFSINGTEVFTAPNTGFLANSNGVGFMVEGANTIEVDKFIFKQNVRIIMTEDAMETKQKVNLGANVNTKYGDLNPRVSPDGKNLYFIVDGHPSNIGGGAQDVWVSNKIDDTTWGKAKSIGIPINNENDNGVISISPDNNILYLSGTYRSKGKHAVGGFSFSKRTGNGWGEPTPMNIEDFYNESSYQEACIGSDNKTMIFTALRNDSHGGNDLYVSFQKGPNQWSAPLNLGNTVNTNLDEATPFLAPDGKTLYFSTNGRPGYGDMDVFVTRRLDNTWTHWSEPQNLGPHINSMEFDAYFSVSAKGDYGYLVTSLNSMGMEDIVRVKLAESAKPEPVVIVHGRILDGKTKKPLSADLAYETLPEGKVLGHASSNPTTGEYKLVLPYEKIYGIFSEKNGYIPQNANIDLTKVHEYMEIEQDLYLYPVEVGEVIIVNNLFFAQSTANILDISYPELDRIVENLKKNPKIEIEISGHTDNIGLTYENQKLSEQRAAAVKEYFVSKGVAANRMNTVGYGDSKPIASNLKEETRKLNRRVEIKVLKK